MLALMSEEDGAAELESDDGDLSLTVSRDGSGWRLSLGFDFVDGLVWFRFPVGPEEAARLAAKSERLALQFPVVPSG